MRKHWDECPGVFCLGEVAKDYLSLARGSPWTSPRWRRLIGVSVCPSTLKGTRPKGDGMGLSPILSAGGEVVGSNDKRSRAGCPRWAKATCSVRGSPSG